MDDVDECIVIGSEKMQVMDRHNRITLKDLRHYGFSEGCPKFLDLQAGCYRTDRHHNDECRLRLYLAYKDATSAKWRRVRHLIDPEPDGDFKQDQLDLEGDESKTAPIALDGENVLQNSVDCEPPNADFPQTPVAMEEQSAMNVDSNSGTDFVDTFGDIYQDSENEMDVADLFGDFDEPLNEDAMVSSLMMAGVNKTKALELQHL